MGPEERQDLQQRALEMEQQEAAEKAFKNASLRRPLYADVESLINPGFLSHKVEICDTLLCIRSPCPGDLFLIRSRVRQSDPDRVWKQWILATCTWMVNGQSLLEDPHAASRLYRVYRACPEHALNILWSVVHGLMNRVSLAAGKVEAFSYEHYSRAIWRTCGRRSPVNDRFTGVPGSERLGMNIVQQSWVAYNISEDDRLFDEQRWVEVKLVASTQSPKGVRKLNAADERRQQQEDRRRRRIQDRLYYDSVGWRDKHAELVFQAHSADELVEQMRRWESGEKDLHDIVVDAWRERVRSDIERMDEAHRAAAEEREQRRQEVEEEMGGDRIVAYTADQVEGLVRNRPRRGPQVFDRTPNRILYDKYIQGEQKVGVMQPGVGAMSRDEDPKSLAEQVQGRRPTFSVDSMEGHVPEHLRERFREDVASSSHGGPPMRSADRERK